LPHYSGITGEIEMGPTVHAGVVCPTNMRLSHSQPEELVRVPRYWNIMPRVEKQAFRAMVER
jgi:hypothetical protein